MKCQNCGFPEAVLVNGSVVCRKCGYTSTPADEAANANYIRVVLGRAPIGGGETPPPMVEASGEISLVGNGGDEEVDGIRAELDQHTKTELLALADGQGIEGVSSSMTKAEIVDAIAEALEG